MGRFIIKLTDPIDSKDYYMEWSTVIDAPVTYGMSKEEFENYYHSEYGRQGMNDYYSRMERVEIKGCSSYGNTTVEDVLRSYADKKSRMNILEEILAQFCRDS